jgi:hypothetical protein
MCGQLEAEPALGSGPLRTDSHGGAETVEAGKTFGGVCS